MCPVREICVAYLSVDNVSGTNSTEHTSRWRRDPYRQPPKHRRESTLFQSSRKIRTLKSEILHRGRRVKSTIVITLCPSRTSVRLLSFTFKFLTSPLAQNGFWWHLTESKNATSSTAFVFSDKAGKQRWLSGLWLTETFSLSSPQTLSGIWWNSTGSEYTKSSIKFVFRPDRKTRATQPLIGNQQRWNVVLRCTIQGPFGLLFIQPFVFGFFCFLWGTTRYPTHNIPDIMHRSTNTRRGLHGTK